MSKLDRHPLGRAIKVLSRRDQQKVIAVTILQILMGGLDLTKKKIVITEAVAEVKDAAGSVITPAVAETAIQWGAFITATIDFVVVAFVMFMIIKAMNKMKKKAEASPAAPAEPSSTDKLLAEIRDSLKK